MQPKEVRIPRREARLLVKSFGYGVMSAELVPPPDLGDMTNGSKQTYIDDLHRRIGIGFGAQLQEVHADPGTPGRSFFLLAEGFEPSIYEKNQTSTEEMDAMSFIAELHSNGLFSDRLKMLKKAHGFAD